MQTLRLLVLCLLPLVAACGGKLSEAVPRGMQDILKDPDRVTLYTIATTGDTYNGELSPEEFEALPAYGEDTRARILDEVELDPATEGKAAIDAFVAAVMDGEVGGGMACFEPHHALRIEKDGRVLDILVCIKCKNYHVMPDGGYNNMVMPMKELEHTWRGIVRKHNLRDISDK